MTWKISFLILFLFLSCKEQPKKLAEETPEITYFNTHALIESDEVEGLLNTEGYKIIDIRRETDFKQGHIPGAIRVWRTDIEDVSAPVKGLIIKKEALVSLLSSLGISTSDTLILYDENASCDAARLWWVLDYYGHKKTRILNGGLTSWKEGNKTLSTQEISLPATDFKFSKESAALNWVGKEEIYQELTEATPTKPYFIIDARTTDEFTGKRMKSEATRAGRIPGSIHVDWASSTRYNTDKKFKSIAELEVLYPFASLKDSAEIIAYCHSGVRSAHTTFVLTQLLGLQQVKNYDGSWIEWSSQADYPIEKDSITTLFQ